MSEYVEEKGRGTAVERVNDPCLADPARTSPDARAPISAGATTRRPAWKIVLFLLGISGAGVAAELYLLDHYEDWRQWIPFAAIAAVLACAAGALIRPSMLWLRSLQFLAPALIVIGGLGVYFHVAANLEFLLEYQPTVKGSEKFWNVMKGAFPALAPLSVAQLGLIALLAAHLHPGFRRPKPAAHQRNERKAK